MDLATQAQHGPLAAEWQDGRTNGRSYARPMAYFDEEVESALASLPPELQEMISNVAIFVEQEPPAGQPLLGLYQGIPLTRRNSGYTGVMPDKITIYQGPLERLYGADRESLRRQIRRVVLHEVAHHFGISDERLEELGRY
jgi:predicted Zn-dependent protease with MMP-like domain